MTPTGRASVGRSYFLPARARERARDDWNSKFNCNCALDRRLMLGDLACHLPFRRASGHRISASHAGRTDGRRRVDRKGSKTVNSLTRPISRFFLLACVRPSVV